MRASRPRASGAGPVDGVEEVPQGEQPAAEPFQDGDAGRAQPVGGVHVDGGGQPGQRDHRRRGGGRDLEERVGVGRVAVVLRHQVDGERGHADRRVGGHRGQAVGEDPVGVGAATPDVQGVLGHQALVEAVGQGREGGRAQRGEAARRGCARGRRPGCARRRSRGRSRCPCPVGVAGSRRARPGCRRARPGRRPGGRRRRRRVPPMTPIRRPPRRSARPPSPSRGASGRPGAAPPPCRPRGPGAATSGAGRRRGWSRAPGPAPGSRRARRGGRRSRRWS